MAAGSTYTPIATYNSTNAASVTFTSIPQTYTDLVVAVQVIGNSTYTCTQPWFRFNNDSSSIYSTTVLKGDGSSSSSYRTTGSSIFQTDTVAGNGVPGTMIVNIQNYSNTTTYKTVIYRAGIATANTEAYVGLYRSTNAITEIDLLAAGGANGFATYSATLYGIASA
jgi:hypothetical protein